MGANGDQESHLLHPLDISDHGVKLGGVQAGFNIGEIIGIQYRHHLAKFREWYGSGAECTERIGTRGMWSYPPEWTSTESRLIHRGEQLCDSVDR